MESLEPAIRSWFTDMVVNRLRYAASQGPQFTEDEIKEKLVLRREEKESQPSKSVSITCGSFLLNLKTIEVTVIVSWVFLYSTIKNCSSHEHLSP